MTGSTEPVSYAYDALYRLKTLTDGGGHTTSYFYNAAGYLAQVVYPGAQATPPTAPLAAGSRDTMTFSSYDADGNLLSRVDGNNITTTYTYNDPESRLTNITYPAGTIDSVHLAYDAYGRRSAMTDGTGGQTYIYDDDDDLTSKTVNWGEAGTKTLSYAFYPNASRRTMAFDGHTTAYSYDGVGRMSSLSYDGTLQSSYTYQDNSWLGTQTLGNGVATSYTLDPLGRLRDLANRTGGGATLSDFAVPAAGGYDGVGNKLSVTATLPGAAAVYSGTTSYQYDYGQTANPQARRSQLTQETSTRASGSFSYGYDGGTSTGPGNPTSFKGTANTFNADNQQTGSGYGYDGNGNPTTYKGKTLTFDPENRLTSLTFTAKTGGTSSYLFAYDGDGHQVYKQASGAPQSYYKLYDGDTLVGLYLHNDNTIPQLFLTSTMTFGADGLVSAHNASGTATFYTFDERGNVAQRVNASGTVTSTDLYDAYGSGTPGGGDVFGYGGQAGYYTDVETGLILCTHRFYDPQAGRWLTRDPIGYQGGVNLYGYTQNNPGNGMDSSGYDKDGHPSPGPAPYPTPPIVPPLPKPGPGPSGPPGGTFPPQPTINPGPPATVNVPVSGGGGSGTIIITLPAPINLGPGGVGGTYDFGSPGNGVSVTANYPFDGSGGSTSIKGSCEFRGGGFTGTVGFGHGPPSYSGTVNGTITTSPGGTVTLGGSGSAGSGSPSFGGTVTVTLHPF